MGEEFSAYQDSRSWETCPKEYSRVVIGRARGKRRREETCVGVSAVYLGPRYGSTAPPTLGGPCYDPIDESKSTHPAA